MRLEHYQQSLRMLQRVAPRHPLVTGLADELDHCPITIRWRRDQPSSGDSVVTSSSAADRDVLSDTALATPFTPE